MQKRRCTQIWINVSWSIPSKCKVFIHLASTYLFPGFHLGSSAEGNKNNSRRFSRVCSEGFGSPSMQGTVVK
jgi:hypothetical protein